MQQGLKLLKGGDSAAARRSLAKAVQVTPAMCARLMKVLTEKNIKFLMAPYEADAQLAHLAHNKVIDLVIAEDSDLLVYQCPIVLFKMDQSGLGQEIRLRNLGANEELDLLCWTHEMFVDMCILSGCDYCPRLNGLGLKRAHKLIQKYRSARKLFKAAEKGLEPLFVASADYFIKFSRAQLVFRHQRVWDTKTMSTCHLTPVVDRRLLHCNLDFLGPACDFPGGIVGTTITDANSRSASLKPELLQLGANTAESTKPNSPKTSTFRTASCATTVPDSSCKPPVDEAKVRAAKTLSQMTPKVFKQLHRKASDILSPRNKKLRRGLP